MTGAAGEMDHMRASRLGATRRQAPQRVIEVEFAPLGVGHFAFALPGEDQQAQGRDGDVIRLQAAVVEPTRYTFAGRAWRSRMPIVTWVVLLRTGIQ
jgi:hypothetical protein